jgi:hypothetical protein
LDFWPSSCQPLAFCRLHASAPPPAPRSLPTSCHCRCRRRLQLPSCQQSCTWSNVTRIILGGSTSRRSFMCRNTRTAARAAPLEAAFAISRQPRAPRCARAPRTRPLRQLSRFRDTRIRPCTIRTRVADSYELQPPGASVAIGAIRAVLEQGGSS